MTGWFPDGWFSEWYSEWYPITGLSVAYITSLTAREYNYIGITEQNHTNISIQVSDSV